MMQAERRHAQSPYLRTEPGTLPRPGRRQTAGFSDEPARPRPGQRLRQDRLATRQMCIRSSWHSVSLGIQTGVFRCQGRRPRLCHGHARRWRPVAASHRRRRSRKRLAHRARPWHHGLIGYQPGVPQGRGLGKLKFIQSHQGATRPAAKRKAMREQPPTFHGHHLCPVQGTTNPLDIH